MKQICIFLLTFSLCSTGKAFDTGLPALAAEPYSLELVAERFQREIHQEIRDLDGTFFGDQEEDRLFARLMYRPSHPWSFQLNAGISDSEGSEDPAALYGATVMWNQPFAQGAQAHIYLGALWVNGIEYRQPGAVVGDQETAAETREEDHVEATLGFLVSKSFDVKDDWALSPYIGMQLSIFRGDGDESFFFESDPDLPRGNASGIDFEEDGQLGSTLGFRVDGPSQWYLRVEGRIIDQKSISAGIGRNF